MRRLPLSQDQEDLVSAYETDLLAAGSAPAPTSSTGARACFVAASATGRDGPSSPSKHS